MPSQILDMPHGTPPGSGSTLSHSPSPPPYSSENGDVPIDYYSDESIEKDAVTFADLDISSGPHSPTANYCLLHLKLLYAFEALKEDIGYVDGLWGLWNSRAAQGVVHIPVHDELGCVTEKVKDATNDDEARQTALSQIREKRWALFVARAVDRYEAWLNSMSEGPRLHEEEMEKKGSDSYEYFVKDGQTRSEMTMEQLPPLGEQC